MQLVRSPENFGLLVGKFLVMAALSPCPCLLGMRRAEVKEFLSQEELGSEGCPRPVCGLGTAGLMVGIMDDLKGIFYPK